ncbi:hypothetical protein [Mangrovimonas spongiae]|uniref:Uncharacterized protein n=1 Tax=Mangrovimonas spongiae TaxID=2494697 RepID=A0A3R9NWE2_9FLAO|nr:hypothetical protein [Mangrovimonas spongiae]RSK39093.1 hypothetical protein EJA19_09125 [Mangrovimonas spongiae]
MNTTLRSILAIIAGIVIGGIVNMGIITISGSIIPPPEGADLSTAEGIKAAADLLEAKHYIMPFLAHAIGTLVGALITAKIVTKSKFAYAMFIGVFFLLGGISAAFMIPAPTWFIILDLAAAYIPMAWLGYKLVEKNNRF